MLETTKNGLKDWLKSRTVMASLASQSSPPEPPVAELLLAKELPPSPPDDEADAELVAPP